jgi:NAD(P)-dependent dehydrogenase (short-subunit alcohol dehydrogenase family)
MAKRRRAARVAPITAGASGIGKAPAELFAIEGGEQLLIIASSNSIFPSLIETSLASKGGGYDEGAL